MKNRFCAALLSMLLAVSLLAGCELSAAPTEPTESRSILQVDITADAPAVADVQIGAEHNHFTSPTQSSEPTQPSQPTLSSRLTKEEAIAIALNHAGLTAEQVTVLRAEFDMDDGVPEYEVEFRFERWEYDYEIHAETGEVRKAEKEQDHD